MLNEDDKRVLDSMDAQMIEQLVLTIDSLILEANQLLNVYPEVDFGNVYDTAAYQSVSIDVSLREFSHKVWTYFIEIFGDNQPTAQRQFGMARMLIPEAISEYGTLLNTLKKKRDILVEFKNDLKSYIENK